MWGKNKEFYRAGYLTEEPNLYRRTKAQHEGKKFQDYKHGRITTNEIGLTTREGYPAPRRKMGGEDARWGAGTEEGMESGGGREREKRRKEGGKRDEKKGCLHHMGERRRNGERKREGKEEGKKQT